MVVIIQFLQNHKRIDEYRLKSKKEQEGSVSNPYARFFLVSNKWLQLLIQLQTRKQ